MAPPAARVSRVSSLLFLLVVGAGAFLAGLELMITAVALPSIIADPAITDWTQLRRASWIVNGYLLAYVTAMPLAGRASDRLGVRRLVIAALALFALGSLLAGAARSLDLLVAGRVIQGFGGGALVPLATAAASHLANERDRPRALGVIGALTFLGMAAGPFVGAAVLDGARFEPALRDAGASAELIGLLAPSWRWVFYLNVPLAGLALLYVWALRVETPRAGASIDLLGGALFAVALAAGLVAITWSGAPDRPVGDEGLVALVVVSLAASALAWRRGSRTAEPFLDPAHFRDRAYLSAVLLSLLTGYGFATAIVGAVVFVDRVIYAGPVVEQATLGMLAGTTAVGALASGFLVRRFALAVPALVGLALSAVALWRMSGWGSDVGPDRLAVDLAVFGLGFGVTVTPRSTAAVEAVGRAAFGAASAAVTVARMVGMAVGLAVLTQIGSNRIDALARIIADPALRDAVLPPELRGLPLQNALVVHALERWAAGEAAQIMSVVFGLALAVTLAAVLPAVGMGGGRGARPSPEPAHRPSVAL